MHWAKRTPLLNRNVHIANFELYGFSPCPSIAARWNDVLLYTISAKWRSANDVSGERRSAERRFVKITFGWTTIREHDVRLNNDSEKCHSALWSLANSTIQPCDDSVKWLSAKRFDKIVFRQNDDSMKWRFGKMMWPPIFCTRIFSIWVVYNIIKSGW